MSPRILIRWTLRVVLALSLAVSGMAAGMRGSTGAVHEEAVAAAASDAADLPCHGVVRSPDQADPCDCCPQRSCDTPACMIAGCLPAVLQVAASAPPAAAPSLGALQAPPPAPRTPPFRPPIV